MENIRITGTVLQNETEFARREWLITNGIGGFAGQSLVGANTRGYHGLLVAALKPPLERTLLVSKLDETVNLEGLTYNLGTNICQDKVLGEGYNYLTCFSYGFHPVFTFELDGHILEKRIFMIYGENTTIVEYHYVDGTVEMELHLRPHLTYRDYHGNGRKNDWPWFVEKQNQQQPKQAYCSQYQFTAYPGATPYYMTAPGEWFDERQWLTDIFYPIEEHRGLKAYEDYFVPGYLRCKLQPGESLAVIFSTQAKYHGTEDVKVLYRKELERIDDLLEIARAEDELKQKLVVAADQFIVRRAQTDTATVIAGYPWFTDWGRDSMIAFPGLVLTTHRWREAREILETFARYSRHGLIPNRFPDEGEEPEYNTVDASLWFFVAFYQYYQQTQDQAFILKHLPLLKEMIQYHINGTLWNIKMEADGLLTQGTPGVQLTWMDAKVGDWVVTPRQGKAVEINALWYNAVKIAGIFLELEEAGSGSFYQTLADKIQHSFRQEFWNATEGYLYDRIDENAKDATIRPNQTFALSLPFPLLERAEGARVLAYVRQHLLTPYGLRSLSPIHAEYRGYFGGEQKQRDAAYHQGTVWSWLIGSYLDALLYVEGDLPETRSKIKQLLEPLLAHMVSDGAIGQISEIFAGDRPYNPEGCYAQAWSVAEVLRIWDKCSR